MAVATLFFCLTRPSGFFLFESVAKVELSQSLELVVKPLPLAFVPSSLSSVDRGEQIQCIRRKYSFFFSILLLRKAFVVLEELG